MKKNKLLLVTLAFIVLASLFMTVKGFAEAIVEEGKKVVLEGSIWANGSLILSSEGKTPFETVCSSDTIPFKLKSALMGKKEGDQITVEIKPEDVYYEVPIEDALKEISKEGLIFAPVGNPVSAGTEPRPGMLVLYQLPDGSTMPFRISEVKEKTVVIDLNRPFSGMTLLYKMKIIGIK